jgi:N-hydroxyarylamine O-acetyltransferase
MPRPEHTVREPRRSTGYTVDDGWALSETGFDVTRIAAGVLRQERGDAALANHLCLLVRTPEDPDTVYLADVGFGGSMIEPIRLAQHSLEQAPYRLGLQRLEDGHWRFREKAAANSMSYDFVAVPEPGAESAMARKCEQLQSDPESQFVLNLVAQKRLPEAHVSLRGRVLTITTSSGEQTRTLRSREELSDTLKQVFHLEVPGTRDLWPKIIERHEVLFG